MTYLFSSNSVITNEVEVKFGGSTVDSFGRLRISSPHTIFDNNFSIDDKPKIWDTVTEVSGSSTFSPNISSVLMSVTTSPGSKVIRQTKQYFQYQPGKSLLTLNTFVMSEGKANLRQRVGYFDTKNGIFLEREGNTAYIVKRSFVTGTVVETKIPQSSWNVDKLDGTGESTKSLNLDKSHIFFTDIEWLGVGSVRLGFVVDGQFVIAHQFNHANIESNVYMTTATLPVRYEIENLGVTNSPSTLKQICSTVISEAGYAPATITRSAATDLAGLTMSQTEFRPILALRLKPGYTNQVVLPARIDFFGLQGTPFVYKMVGNANIIGGAWLTTGQDSVVEFNSNATTLGVGGYELMQGIFVGGTSAQPVTVNLKENNHSLQLRANMNGSSEVLAVVVKATTNNDDALGSITWEEHN